MRVHPITNGSSQIRTTNFYQTVSYAPRWGICIIKLIWFDASCELYGLIGGVFGFMSINTLAVIAFDRYNVIARPIKASRSLGYRRAFFMLTAVWTWSTTWTLPPLFGFGAYIPEGFQTSCTFDYLTRDKFTRIHILCMYIFGFSTPLCIILFCYYHIYRAVAAHEKEMGQMAKKLNAEIRQGQSAKKAEIKTARIAMTIILTFLCSWVPYATVALIAQFGPQELVTPYVSELPVVFAKASAMHNPLIYALSHPKFREAVDKRFPWLLCCCGRTNKEKEDTASVVPQSKKSQMKRMDSVNSTAAGGTQSQMSEISNLESDTNIDDLDTDRTKSVSVRGRTAKKQEAPKQDNAALVQDIMAALATAMSGQQQAQATPAQPLANMDPQQLQSAIYAISQGQLPQNMAHTQTTASASGPSVSAQPAAGVVRPGLAVVTTEAEVNGGVANKAYQAD